MRLTEEVFQLLSQLQNPSTQISFDDFAEAILECEHEGLIARTENNHLKITESGIAKFQNIRQRLISVDQLRLHEEAKVAFIRQQNYDRFQKLQSLGISSGVPLKIRQRFPSFVIQCEETEIALEEDIARDIFVLRRE